MTRKDAMAILNELDNSPNMVKHGLACEKVMRELAKKFEPEKEENWAIVGLLHDADYEKTDKSLDRHTDLISKELAEIDAPKEIIKAIRGHCDKEERDSKMAKAIYACDELTGLIVACALVHPSKKLEEVTVESVLKKFKDPSFAKGANRDQIKTCGSELGIPLPDFVKIALSSMQEINKDLGL